MSRYESVICSAFIAHRDSIPIMILQKMNISMRKSQVLIHKAHSCYDWLLVKYEAIGSRRLSLSFLVA